MPGITDPKQFIPSYDIQSTIPSKRQRTVTAEWMGDNKKLAAHCANNVTLWDNLTM